MWYRIWHMGSARKKHIIILGGYPGSGKSTVKRLLAERLGYQTFSTGDYVRQLAQERGLTLEEFNEKIAESKDIDLLIDAKLEHIEAAEDRYIIDSHLAFYFVPSGFSVFLNVSLETSATRIYNDRESLVRKMSGDSMLTLEEARERTAKRIQNHVDRYWRHYGIDPYREEQYDMVVDSETETPEMITEQVLKTYEAWLKNSVPV